LPFSLCKKPGITFSQKCSAFVGPEENEREVFIEGGIEDQDTSVDGVTRGNISVLQSEKAALTPGSEDLVEQICSGGGGGGVVISDTSTPPRIPLSAAERIKNEVTVLHPK
jgi:hypothetical protein